MAPKELASNTGSTNILLLIKATFRGTINIQIIRFVSNYIINYTTHFRKEKSFLTNQNSSIF